LAGAHGSGAGAARGRQRADAIRPLFAADPARFDRFSRRADGMLLDLSKTAITDETLAALLDLARAADLEGKRAAMAAGEPVNGTERRAVLHMALRAPRAAGFRGAGGEDASADVHAVLERMQAFCASVQGGRLLGAAGERFTTCSTSASAARTSAPPWRRGRCGRPIARCGRTTSATWTRTPGKRCGRGWTRGGPWC
jgi:hypothetical protein